MPRSERTPKPIRIKLTPAEKEAIYALPLSAQFRIVHMDAESGCAVYQHILVDTEARDYTQILAVAKAYATETDCWINPEVMPQAVAARQKLYQGITDNANPDLTTSKYGYMYVKSPLNKNNIVRNANLACNQGAIAVLTDLCMERDEISVEELTKFSERVFSEHNRNHKGEPNYTKDEVHWLIKGSLIKCNRPKKQ